MISGMMTSKWVSATAMGAVSIASPYISIIYAYALIFGVGGATMIAIYRGCGEEETAKKVFTMNMAFMVGSTVLIGLAGFVFTRPLALLLGATPESIGYVVEYLKIITAVTLPYGLCYTLSMMLKVDGFPQLGLLGSALGAIANLSLLYLLVSRYGLGIKGVAIASVVAQTVISAIYAGYFFTKRATLKLVRFRMDRKEIWRIIRLGIPDAISEGSSGIFVMIFNIIVFRILGEVGIIAFSVVNYMNLLAVQMTLGATQGMQPLVSYHYGRGEKQLCELYLNYARATAGTISFIMFAVCQLAGGRVVGMFIDPAEAEAFRAAVYALRTFSWFLLLVGLSIVSIGYFSAIERPRWSQTLSVFRGILGIGLLGVLLSALFGETGTWISPAVTEAITIAAAFVFFRRLNADERWIQRGR